MSVPVGTTIAGYTILRLVGSGGMAEVYLAQPARSGTRTSSRCTIGASSITATRRGCRYRTYAPSSTMLVPPWTTPTAAACCTETSSPRTFCAPTLMTISGESCWPTSVLPDRNQWTYRHQFHRGYLAYTAPELKAPTCRSSRPTTSTTSPPNSRADPAKRSAGKHPPKPSTNYCPTRPTTRCCIHRVKPPCSSVTLVAARECLAARR
jgi:hypothetical protein